MNSNLEVNPLPGCGAEILGVDLRKVSESEFDRIRACFADYGLVFFRDQSISETEHISFAERWGTINVNRFFVAHDKYPQIAMVGKEPSQTINIGGDWHTDHSYDFEPALGSILVARELPESGGDTCFADMAKVFASLSPGLKQTLCGLNAVHSAHHVFGSDGAHKEQGLSDRVSNTRAADALEDPVHPVVIEHPLSGKQVLYVNPGFTVRFEGWTEAESAPLLSYLYSVAQQPEFVTQFAWRPGSIAFWDNRATWHSANNDYQGMRRVMHRITIEGCALTGG